MLRFSIRSEGKLKWQKLGAKPVEKWMIPHSISPAWIMAFPLRILFALQGILENSPRIIWQRVIEHAGLHINDYFWVNISILSPRKIVYPKKVISIQWFYRSFHFHWLSHIPYPSSLRGLEKQSRRTNGHPKCWFGQNRRKDGNSLVVRHN